MRKIFTLLIFLNISFVFSQEISSILSLEEYLGYVKKYHPIVKQSQLITTNSEAKLLKARGAFDPKIEVDYNRKKFKETEYYDKLNTTFKIPTWYGIELKANYENNDGAFLNPEFNTPNNGLYSAGFSIPLAKNLLTNKRMATLKKAKSYNKLAQAKQQLVVNDILYEAISVYYNWLKNYNAKLIYEDYLANANIRFNNVKSSFMAGDKPAIDTLEAKINYKNRVLDLEKSKINYIKSKLELSNYLWLENNLPVELETTIKPDINTLNTIDTVLNSSVLNIQNDIIKNHPKIQELNAKRDILITDKRLKKNNLLPTIDLEYNFLTTEYNTTNSLNTANYKSGLSINFPLFLRKERADLKLAKLKLKDTEYTITATEVSLKNKIESLEKEIESYTTQHSILKELVKDNKKFVKSEERKFILGEGSLFLVNYREVKFIESQLKNIDIEYLLLKTKSNLLRTLGNL
ncbi:outer membrane protein TolC [Maribacter vaceletii]|uniref:Outer membrane protein TolC n=1 Tax=Maribacter vaceletii TaxID=1206816 RepID=A0A495E842_9FLAO|nr:TolC family protein [Maribacter vaceletii]RKR13094.1 outer membrane protein TolC [Maribacter vaceletii]